MVTVKDLEKADRQELAEAIEKISRILWQPRQTFPEAKHEVAVILKKLKEKA